MKKNIFILILVTTGFFSCNQNNKVPPEKNEQSKNPNEKYIYTNYKYSDSNGASLIIQNSLPKGGMKYTATSGEVYNYVVFWTRIINQTNNSLELKIDFPVDSYEVPSLPGKYFKILIPSDTMTLEKAPLFNYGLNDIKSFLDTNINKSSSLKRTINAKQSSGFYVVMLCSIDGANGTMRTGLSLRGQKLFYKLKIDGSNSNSKSSDKEINCGNINLKNLMLEK